MTVSALIFLLLIFAAFSFFMARQKISTAYRQTQQKSKILTLPKYFGYVAALTALLPALVMLFFLQMAEEPYINSEITSYINDSEIEANQDLDLYLNEIKSADTPEKVAALSPEKQVVYQRYHEIETTTNRTISVIVLSLSILLVILGMRKINTETPARRVFEKIIEGILLLAASIAIMTTVGIVFSVLFESTRFFGEVPIMSFMFGTEWSPQTAIRADQVGSSAAFGAVPLFVGTMLISFIALLVSVPLGLMSAIYLSEYAGSKIRAVAKPVLEILAGIPTVVYGFFAALTVAPFIRDLGESIGLSVASESALAAGLVMGIMIIPFVSSLSDDVLSAVPQNLREGSLGLGATRSETIVKVLIPAALPGIVGGVLLAASRAIGETMIVVMAAGLAANLTVNPLEAVTTVTVQIVTLLTGDQEFNSAKTLAAFALGLMLFVTTLILNVIALHVVRKYREQYE
ncbi:phosphate ABC transporter permease subunit PstC [Marinicella sp. S1101]|uniref:phosphate ABC transporter permease subunit PstC n=1 Tax=Marinicella marina TaxID=2996016 RepID=UPI002260FDE3|nr:phosphate ABC transporter permease subunit PstC [Marinicella marina]MCX7553096.1 phosphate ABC transporter permease subunit PstC [Marinicella marina]MDJ1138828.1 phosphate ABC transporter permease subunit PstC [Marinicella marina]